MNVLKNKDYSKFLDEVKQKIQSAKLQVARSVNSELIIRYFNIGKSIVERPEKFGWGKAIVEQLASEALPIHLAEQAAEAMKSSYNLDTIFIIILPTNFSNITSVLKYIHKRLII